MMKFFILFTCVLICLVSLQAKKSFRSDLKSPSRQKQELALNDFISSSRDNSAASFDTVVASQPVDASSSRAGALAVLGGALAHICFGSFYCWGNFLSYAPDSIKYFDGVGGAGKQPDAVMVLPLTILAICCTMPLGPRLVQKIGAAKTTLIGAWTMILGVYFSSFQQKLLNFMLFKSMIFGFGVGLAYTAPMTAGWKWLPESKGLVSGAILAGFGLGGFFFNLIGTKLVNPNGLEVSNGKFPQEVYDNFPVMLRKLSCIYAVVCTLGYLLISEPKPIVQPVNGKDKKTAVITTPGIGVMAAVKTPQFWLLWGMIFTCASAGLNVAAVYKQFSNSSPALEGDSYKSQVGAVGAVFQAVGRLFWGILSDKIGFKTSFLLLSGLQGVLHLVYPYSTSSKSLFLIATSLCYFFLAGNFALIPPAVQRIFGPAYGTTIYGVLYTSFAAAGIGGLAISGKITKSLGWTGGFQALGVASLLATIITTQLRPVASFASSTV